jgi:hypothetical protein
MDEKTQDAIATLLTVDGKGREAKREALLKLLDTVQSSGENDEDVRKEIEGYRRVK